MDTVTLWAWAMSALVLGLALTLLCGAYWFVLGRRDRMAARLVSADGTLNALSLRRVHGSRGSSYWTIDATYEYSVQGHRYEGHRPSLDMNSFTTEAKAREATTGLAPGPVTVWYDPANPSWSSLSNRRPQHLPIMRMLTLIAAGFAIFGGLATVLSD
jgi:hypothetical protein